MDKRLVYVCLLIKNKILILKIPSGSEFLINPSGSFKRFDSIDRDYKPLNQTSSTSPSWSLVAPNIPPQPLRPAPAPISPKERKSPAEKSPKQHRYIKIK